MSFGIIAGLIRFLSGEAASDKIGLQFSKVFQLCRQVREEKEWNRAMNV